MSKVEDFLVWSPEGDLRKIAAGLNSQLSRSGELYRGVSGEEYDILMKSGKVASMGHGNTRRGAGSYVSDNLHLAGRFAMVAKRDTGRGYLLVLDRKKVENLTARDPGNFTTGAILKSWVKRTINLDNFINRNMSETVSESFLNPSMLAKYKMSQRTSPSNPRAFQIVALKSFKSANGQLIRAGMFGGFIESHKNLSHDGNCWVNGLATVSGNARVKGNAFVDGAEVDGNATIKGNAVVSGRGVRITGKAVIAGGTITDSVQILGGIVQGKASLSGSVVLTGNAKVSGEAKLRDYVVVSERSIVAGKADLSGNVVVKDRAFVGGDTVLMDQVRVYNRAVVKSGLIKDNSRIHGSARILGKGLLRNPFTYEGVNIHSNADVSGNVVVKDNVEIGKNAKITGNVTLSGDSQYENVVVDGEEIKPVGSNIEEKTMEYTEENIWEAIEQENEDMLHEGARIVAKIGKYVVRYNNEWEEYTVSVPGEPESKWYHTDDKQDALDTARVMSKQKKEGWDGKISDKKCPKGSSDCDIRDLKNAGKQKKEGWDGKISDKKCPKGSSDCDIRDLKNAGKQKNEEIEIGLDAFVEAIAFEASHLEETMDKDHFQNLVAFVGGLGTELVEALAEREIPYISGIAQKIMGTELVSEVSEEELDEASGCGRGSDAKHPNSWQHLLGKGDANAKLAKGSDYGDTLSLSLAPGKLSGVNLCSNASPECLKLCLNTSGRGGQHSIQAARLEKARAFVSNVPAFVKKLETELEAAVRKMEKTGRPLAVRLNMVSDVAWEKFGIIQKFPQIQFYDYTKSFPRAMDHAKGRLPGNYHLTFSRSEENWGDAIRVLQAGGNVAVVFNVDALPRKKKGVDPDTVVIPPGSQLPKEWNGYKVIDGDKTDLRFLDPKSTPGVIVGLRPKGKALKTTGEKDGFVVKNF